MLCCVAGTGGRCEKPGSTEDVCAKLLISVILDVNAGRTVTKLVERSLEANLQSPRGQNIVDKSLIDANGLHCQGFSRLRRRYDWMPTDLVGTCR
jgi:hypothetical protein